MKTFPLSMDSLHYEIRYEYGNLYFDRCGQCVNDIERNCEGWRFMTADPSKGLLECPAKSFSAQFTHNRFIFSASKASSLEIKSIAREANNVWKIIKANLGLDQFLRQGCRVYFLKPATSTEEAEKLIDKAEVNVDIPQRLIDSGFNKKNSHLTTVVARGDFEYRIQMMSITRFEAMNPDLLIREDPRFLSSKQKEIRLQKLQRMSEYSANPMYAACLDVDCYQALPSNIFAEEFILEQYNVVASNFVSLLEKK